MKHITRIFITLSITACLSLPAQDDQNILKGGYFDATEEINLFDRQFEQKEKETEQVVFGAFANIVQNLFNIVQNPNDPTTVVNNVASMIAKIVGTGITIVRSMPIDITVEERQQFIDELQMSLEREMRSLMITRSSFAAL